MAYLLDSDVFIQARNLHYGFDFCPAFWDWIDQQAAARAALSIEKVRDELVGGGDDLATWAQQRGDEFFLTPDTDVLASLRAVSTWAERAKGDETTSYADLMSASRVGSLIQATSGSLGGVGGWCRNRAGLAA